MTSFAYKGRISPMACSEDGGVARTFLFADSSCNGAQAKEPAVPVADGAFVNGSSGSSSWF